MWNVPMWKPCIAVRRASMQIHRRWTHSKKIFAVNLRHKEGRQLALEHFDFYYKPIFRQRWPSIRLGLTSRSKKGAMINNFGPNSSDLIEDFETAGAVDLIPLLEECKARRMKESVTNEIPSKDMEADTDTEPTVDQSMDEPVHTSVVDDRRTAETIHEYIMPTKFVTRDTVPEFLEERSELLGTWKAEDVEFVRGEDIIYPKHLRVYVYPMGEIAKFDEPVLDDNMPLKSHQILDPASLLPILALDIRPDEDVLDLCAAPGEKALAMLQTLIRCNLVCNDMNFGRISLLRHNLLSFIPRDDDVRRRVQFLRFDAARLQKRHTNEYHKILVDVPSTEDRRSLRLPDREGNMFRRSMANERLQLPDQQTQMLIGGLKALRRGGCLVYTTATLSPNQNDEVVETALRRLQQDAENDAEFAVCDLQPLAEDFYDAKVLRFARGQCRYGQLVIPFLPNNYGPLYTCKLKRVQ